MAFFCLSVIVFIYVGYGSCASFLQAWLGFLPMILVASGVQAGESLSASLALGLRVPQAFHNSKALCMSFKDLVPCC